MVQTDPLPNCRTESYVLCGADTPVRRFLQLMLVIVPNIKNQRRRTGVSAPHKPSILASPGRIRQLPGSY